MSLSVMLFYLIADPQVSLINFGFIPFVFVIGIVLRFFCWINLSKASDDKIYSIVGFIVLFLGAGLLVSFFVFAYPQTTVYPFYDYVSNPLFLSMVAAWTVYSCVEFFALRRAFKGRVACPWLIIFPIAFVAASLIYLTVYSQYILPISFLILAIFSAYVGISFLKIEIETKSRPTSLYIHYSKKQR